MPKWVSGPYLSSVSFAQTLAELTSCILLLKVLQSCFLYTYRTELFQSTALANYWLHRNNHDSFLELHFHWHHIFIILGKKNTEGVQHAFIKVITVFILFYYNLYYYILFSLHACYELHLCMPINSESLATVLKR